MDNQIPRRHSLLPAGLSAWFAYLALDFLFHAVVLASWWRATEAYWLPPEALLRLIPLGYASFAAYCAALTWLLKRLYGERLTAALGLRFGAGIGLAFGTTFILASYSVFRMPVSSLLLWPLSIVIESAVSGAAAAWALVSAKPWRRAGMVLAAALLLFVVSVILQNVFFPTSATRIVGTK